MTTTTITAIANSPASGDLGVGKTVTFTLTLNDAVTVSGGTPTLTLNDGGYGDLCQRLGHQRVDLSYTVGASNTDVASLAATALNANGGSTARGLRACLSAA